MIICIGWKKNDKKRFFFFVLYFVNHHLYLYYIYGFENLMYVLDNFCKYRNKHSILKLKHQESYVIIYLDTIIIIRRYDVKITVREIWHKLFRKGRHWRIFSLIIKLNVKFSSCHRGTLWVRLKEKWVFKNLVKNKSLKDVMLKKILYL